jgi:hypothetical protein
MKNKTLGTIGIAVSVVGAFVGMLLGAAMSPYFKATPPPAAFIERHERDAKREAAAREAYFSQRDPNERQQ